LTQEVLNRFAEAIQVSQRRAEDPDRQSGRHGRRLADDRRLHGGVAHTHEIRASGGDAGAISTPRNASAAAICARIERDMKSA